MSYRSLLVNIDIDGPVAPLVTLALELASRFDARLVGFSAADAPLPVAGPEAAAMVADVWQQQQDDISRCLKIQHAEFDRLTAGRAGVEWRQMVDDPSRSLAAMARVADLVITGSPSGAENVDVYRCADLGSVLLQAGRPVLVAASGVEHLAVNKIVIAWKDCREARRAVVDALPLLRSANEVIVLTVAGDLHKEVRAGVADVVAFLAQHGIRARTELIEDDDETARLVEFVVSCHADLVVSGAYGHSRLREWAFGGVTRSLLEQAGLSRLMSS